MAKRLKMSKLRARRPGWRLTEKVVSSAVNGSWRKLVFVGREIEVRVEECVISDMPIAVGRIPGRIQPNSSLRKDAVFVKGNELS